MPTRSALPQDYLLNSGTSFEDFETIGDFTIVPGAGMDGTGTANTSQYKTGSQSLKLTSTTNSGFLFAKRTISLNASTLKNISFWVYLHSSFNSSQVIVDLSQY